MGRRLAELIAGLAVFGCAQLVGLEDREPTGSGGVPLPAAMDPLLWLDATQGLGSAPAVARWPDISGNQYDGTQDDSALQPQFVASGGRAAVAFDGADFLNLPPGFSDFSDGLTFFAVVELELFAWCSQLFHLSNGGEIDEINLHFLQPQRVILEMSEGLFEWEGPLPELEVVLLGIHLSPSQGATLYLNGSQVDSQPDLRPPAPPQDGTRKQNLFGNGLYELCVPLTGNVHEFVLYDRALGAEDLAAMNTHLQSKWQCCQP
jgi:hypothetical protein